MNIPLTVDISEDSSAQAEAASEELGAVQASFSQERLWFLQQLTPESSAYNINLALRLRGAIRIDLLERAFGEVVDRHEMLRTAFTADGDDLLQIIHPRLELSLPVIDLTAMPREHREAAALEAVASVARRPFALDQVPLLRLLLVRLEPEDHVLLTSMHHVISDGWSSMVLVREMTQAYAAACAGLPSGLPPLAIQYADYAAWQRDLLQGEVLDRQLAYWRGKLEGAATLDFPTDLPRPPVPTYRGAVTTAAVPAAIVDKLREMARSRGATLFMTLLAGFQLLLSRYSGQSDVSVGTPIANRTRAETEPLIGFFVNTLVMRTDLSGEPRFTELLDRVKETALEAYAHQDVPFEKLVQELQPERDTSRSPLFQVMFTLQNAPQTDAELPGLSISAFGGAAGTAKFDLTLTAYETEGGLRCQLEYSTDLFEAVTAQRLAAHFTQLLASIAERPEAVVSRLGFSSEDERRRVLVEWNATETDVDWSSVHQQVSRRAAASPHATALWCDGQALDYAELEVRSSRLAAHLRDLGVRRGTLVAVCQDRTAELVVSLLAVLKAGGAYVPLDPAYPEDRLAYMLEDSGAPVLLAQSRHVPAFSSFGGRRVLVDTDRDAIAACSATVDAERTEGTDLAYVIYTSGSTGRPKGVQVRHGALSNFLASMAKEPGLVPGDVLVAVTSLSFDIAALELFLPLVTGASIVLASREDASDGERLRALLETSGATVMQATPATWRLLLDAGWPGGVALTVLCGGEAMPPALAAELRARAAAVWNLYGPTETTIWSAVDPVGAGRITLGHPIANTELYVLDPHLEPAPIGVPGVLFIGGEGLARGYLGRPSLTAEKFVPAPFPRRRGALVYCTGDRVRHLADGRIEFLGRIDHQVKIRGFRIELGEIEHAIARHPAVRDVVVMAREDVPGDKRLVAYVVARDGHEAPAAAALRASVQEVLPEYMVPAAFVPLERMPLTPNGKVDRRALPAPDTSADAGRTYVAPRSPIEESLAAIYADVLRVEHVGATDSFFELGGHSLLATRVTSRIRRDLGVEIPLRALFEAPTVARLAERVARELAGGDAANARPLLPVPRNGPLPLSFSQERLWFLDRLQPGSSAYNMPASVRFRGHLDERALAAAFQALVDRHEALRTTFGDVDGIPHQQIHGTMVLDLPVIDLTGLTAPEQAAREQARAHAARPFDLGTGPLLRTTLLRLAADDHVLLVSMHHIVSDNWSVGVLSRELATLYLADCGGSTAQLPPLSVQFADFAAWQRAPAHEAVVQEHADYWRARLRDAEPLELPTDRPRASSAHRGRIVEVTVPSAVLRRLQAVARAEGVTTYMAVLAAFQLLLGRYAGTDDVSIGSPMANRQHTELEGVAGFFLSTIVLRTDLSGEPTFRQLLGRVRDVVLGAFAHNDVPFEKLLTEGGSRTGSFFRAMFILQNAPPSSFAVAALRVEPFAVPAERQAKFDLTLSATESPAGLRCSLEYDADLFEPQTAAAMARRLVRLLEGVAARPDVPAARISLLDETEGAPLAGTEVPQDHATTLHGLFGAAAGSTPDAVAVLSEGLAVTYGELDRASNRLARHLQALGVVPESRVGVLFHRSPAMLVAVLAVLKAGAAYVPLDPSYPIERVAFTVEDARMTAVLVSPGLRDKVPSGTPVVELDHALTTIPPHDEGALQPSVVGAEAVAYVIYTSGSTGRPKGVLVPHQTAVAYTRTAASAYQATPADRFLQFASLSFDASIEEIFLAFAVGGSLVLRTDAMLASAEDFLGRCGDWGITVLNVPTAFWHELAVGLSGQGVTAPASLRLVIIGGERALSERLIAWRGAVGDAVRVVNTYGPTEATVVATACDVTGPGRVPTPGDIPIGNPVAGVRGHVLDRHLEPVPPGVPGELFLGGAGVVRGYLGRPELTADRFVPDPSAPGGRLYRSGDRVRQRADGLLEFLGRVDDQVKLRGFRVELGEIEQAIRNHAGAADVAVLAREDEPGALRLVAYLASAGEPPDVASIRRALERALPPYMVPTAFVVLERLPLNASGKLDRRALPRPSREHTAASAREHVAPVGAVEEKLAAIMAEVLRLDRVGADESFFELGGHSLLATQVVARVRSAFGVELPLRTLFEAPTVSQLATRLHGPGDAQGAAAAPPLVRRRPGTSTPLSFGQERMWFLAQLDPGGAAYNMPAAIRMTGELDRSALERALGLVFARHEVLRTVFSLVDGEPRPTVLGAGSFVVEHVDLTDANEREREARRRAALEAKRPFDLTTGPLMRAAVLRLATDEHLLLVTVHHIASDGWSVGVLIREVAAAYQAFARGETPSLPELPIQYADYATWQRDWLDGAVLERQIGYWRRQLQGAAPLELPTDRPRPPIPSGRGATRRFRVDAVHTRALRALCRAEGATLFMGLLAAFQLLLARHAGQDDVSIGTPIANRTRAETDGLIGFFVNTLVMRTDLSGEPTFRELLHQVKVLSLGAYAHQDVPFEKLVEALHPTRDTSRSPLFQVMFALQNAPATAIALSGLTLTPLIVDGTSARFDLTLVVVEAGEELACSFEYATDLFDDETVAHMAERLDTLLAAATATPDASAHELVMLSAAERRQLLIEWRSPELGPRAHRTLHEAVESQAARTPDATAVSCGDHVLTYRELKARAGQLAARLQAEGVGPGSFVAVGLGRSPALVVALLAVLETGAAYVPLDVDYPAQRIAYLLANSGASLLVTERTLETLFAGASTPRMLVDDDHDAGRTPRRIEVDEGAVAYVIYTSGSTGQPKGVAIAHSSVIALVTWAASLYSAEELSRVLASTSVCFDLSIFELFVPLALGGTVHLVRDALELTTSDGSMVSLINTVPSAAAELVRSGANLPFAATINLAGEPLPTSLVDALYERGMTRVLDLYGPSEDTTYSTCALRRRGAPATIGRPLPSTQAHLLDRHQQLVPVGCIGELYLGGVGLAHGYLGRPDLTAERFVPDPFHERPGARMYRTGDLVRHRAGGELEFLGRADHQVKVRGFRIELGEVEHALAAIDGIREVLVMARDDGQGGKRLVAYLVPERDRPAPPSMELRRHLRETLPEYMVPATFVPLARFPLTPNGKIDRKALPEPDGEVVRTDHVEPRTPTEEALATILADVLRLPRVGVTDSFFELGGHSLLATRVVSRLRTTFAVELPLRTLFEAPTVALLAGRVEEALRSTAGTTLPPIVTVSREGDLPLSFGQERLWFLDQLEPGTAIYNMPAALRMSGALDANALERALAVVIERHEALRTTFTSVAGRPVQRIAASGECKMDRIEVTGSTAPERDDHARRMVSEAAREPFDLERGPLMRASLLRLAADEHILLVTIHHIVFDGWSIPVLIREVATAYRAFVDGESPSLPELPVQYADYAAWQRSWLRGEVLERQLAYWRGQLLGAAQLELPTDRPRPPVPSHRGAVVSETISGEITDGLRVIARAEAATLFMTLLAALKVFLARHSNQDDVVVGTPIANRTRYEIEGLVGFFVNTLVLRTDLSGASTFDQVVRRVKESALGAYSHQDVPFERLVEVLQPQRDTSRTPFFQVLFAMQSASDDAVQLPGVRVSAMKAHSATAKFDLTITAAERPSGIDVAFEYSTDLFDPSTIRRFADRFRLLLESITRAPHGRIRALDLVPPAERAALSGWNRGEAVLPDARCIHETIAAAAAERPDAIAVTYEGTDLTYRELVARAGELAARLRELGVGRGALVGVCLERSADLVVALVGVLMAGAAYLPLDPSYPPERLQYMVTDGGAALVIAEPSTRGVLPSGIRVMDLAAGAEAVGHAYVPVDGDPDDLAYVIYTSGSTGQPKGSLVTHRNVARLFTATDAWFHFDHEDVWTMFHSYAFDFSVWEIFGALLYGGRVVVVPYWISRSPSAFHELMRQERVTVLNQTPSAFRQLVAADGEVDPARDGSLALRVVVFGGEALDLETLRPWFARHPVDAPRLVNMYGITETTVHVTYRPIELDDLDRAVASPIGQAIPDLGLTILDRELDVVPIGVPGEIYVGGGGVARGYLGRPALTASRFVPDHVGAQPGRTLYRTGDVARYLAGGEIEYLGRADDQVKIRGFRIELGEIEVALLQIDGVRDAVVLAREDAPGDKRLVAYVIPKPPGVDGARLRTAVRAALPVHMVPSAFVVLDAFPLTSNGKLDRRALPRPVEVEGTATASAAAIEHDSPVEELIAGIWCDLLGLPAVAGSDSFFDVGGHSLLATQVIARVKQSLATVVPVRTLFEAPTLSAFARAVQRAADGGPSAMTAPLVPRPHQDHAPLSFGQDRFWFLQRLHPSSGAYNINTATRLPAELDVSALGRALQLLLERHQSLRTVYPLVGSEPRQMVIDASLELERVELVDEPQADDASWTRWLRERALRAFDLTREVPIRLGLARLHDPVEPHATRAYLLALTLHHIAADGWSMDILLRDLAALYAGCAAGAPVELTPPRVQYADYATWQRTTYAGETLAQDLAYWKAHLEGASTGTDLPTDRARPPVPSGRASSVELSLSAELSTRVRELARREGATLFMTFLAALQVLLARASGRTDVVVGTAVANRTELEVEDVVGFFVNTLVLRADVGACASFHDALRLAREVALGAYAHQALPFERLVQEINPHRDLARAPLFDVMLVMQAPSRRSRGEGGGLQVQAIRDVVGSAAYDLTFSVSDGGTRIGGIVAYATDLFERATVERMAEQLVAVLAAAVDAPRAPLLAMPLGPAARHVAAGPSHEPDLPLHGWFERSVLRSPDAVAIQTTEGVVTYRELGRRVDGLCARLCRAGVQLEQPVAVRAGRDEGLYTAFLAVLKAGATVVPIDPKLPPERVAHILGDSGARVVLTGAVTEIALPPHVQVLSLDATAADTPDGAARPVPPESTAYVIYTSGTSGLPKGVAVEHRNATSMVAASVQRFGISSDDKVLQFVSCGFDVFIADVMMAFAAGATLVVAEQADALQDFPGTVAGAGVTFVQLPASVLAALRCDPVPGLRGLVLGGERWVDAVVDAWSIGRRVFNAYGPTEAAVAATVHEGVHATRRSVIGEALSNTEIHLLDVDLRALPSGIVGEIFIAGAGVARGYVGSAAATARAFIPDPHAAAAGSRMYRTGDFGRWLADGTLEYRGRNDRQVKVRGFRIELEEVEQALLTHPAADAAAVVVVDAQTDGARLVAFAAAPGADPNELLAHMRMRLPEYMVPSAIVILPSLPLGPTGKLDRAALARWPLPSTLTPALGEPPADELERRIAAIWTSVLGVREPSRSTSFFEAGGHSLLALRVTTEVQRALGVRLPLTAIFEAPTLSALAARIRQLAAEERAVLTRLGTSDADPPLVLAPPVGGQLLCYRALASQCPRLVLGMEIDGGDPWTSLQEAARFYATAIARELGSRPFDLGGWSFGGVMALHLAVELAARGATPRRVVAVDSFLDTTTLDMADESVVAALFVDDLARTRGGQGPTEDDGLAGGAFADQIRDAVEAGRLPPDTTVDGLRPQFDLFRRNAAALRDFSPPPSPSPVLLIQAGDASPSRRLRQEAAWQRVAPRGLTTLVVPGNHFNLLSGGALAELLIHLGTT